MGHTQAAHYLFKFLFVIQLVAYQARPATSLRIKNETTRSHGGGAPFGPKIDREAFYMENLKDYKRLIRDDLGKFEDNVVNSVYDQYIEEPRKNDRFSPLFEEASVDERLANMMYTVGSKRVLNIDFAKFDSGDPRLDEMNEYLVTSDRVDDQLCGQHLEALIKLIDEYEAKLERKRANRSAPFEMDRRYLHLARFLDSYGHYAAGLLGGQTHSMGSHEQCITTPMPLNPDEPREMVDSRYCWARLSVDKHLDANLRARKKLPFESKSNPISTGICIPETCHTRHFAQHKKLLQRLVNTQFRLPKSIYIDETLELEAIFCIVDKNSRLGMPISGWVLIGLMSTWSLLALYATIRRDQVKLIKNDKLRRLLICMDLKHSWFEFTTKPKSPISSKDEGGRRVELNTMNPLRWAGCVFVIFGHGILIKGGYFMNHFYGLMKTEQDFMGGFIIVGTTVVDSFFLMTAMTAAFITLKRAHRARMNSIKKKEESANENGQLGANGKGFSMTMISLPEAKKLQQASEKQVVAAQTERSDGNQFARLVAASLLIVQSRYFRLMPMFILAYWFKRSVFIYLGSGPFWDYGFNHETANGACQGESWLVPFTFAASFIPLSRQCLMQSWSISNDMFFFLVAAPIMLIATRRAKLAAVILVSMCAASVYALLSAIWNSDAADDFEIRDLRSLGFFSLFSKNSYIYSSPHYRVSAFAIGLFTGYLLYLYDTKQIEKWPQWFRGPAYKISLLYIAGCFLGLSFGGKYKHLLTPYHYFLYPWFMTLGKITWCLTNSVVFLRMVTDLSKNAWMKAFSSKIWVMAAKLNYVILLIHYDLLQYNETNPPQTNFATFWSVYQTFSSVYIATTFFSIIIHVIFENPIDKIVRTFIVRRKSA